MHNRGPFCWTAITRRQPISYACVACLPFWNKKCCRPALWKSTKSSYIVQVRPWNHKFLNSNDSQVNGCRNLAYFFVSLSHRLKSCYLCAGNLKKVLDGVFSGPGIDPGLCMKWKELQPNANEGILLRKRCWTDSGRKDDGTHKAVSSPGASYLFNPAWAGLALVTNPTKHWADPL